MSVMSCMTRHWSSARSQGGNRRSFRQLGIEAEEVPVWPRSIVPRTPTIPNDCATSCKSLQELADTETVVFPIHPRTRTKLVDLDFSGRRFRFPTAGFRLIEPVSFLDMVQLEKHARVILTDSGGVQKEAYFHGVPASPCETKLNGWKPSKPAGIKLSAQTQIEF